MGDVNGHSRRARRCVSLVDLGSSSARLVVYEYQAGGGLRLVDEIREVVRLGDQMGATGRLDAAAIGRAVGALRSFSDYVHAAGLPPLRVMATSAVRRADNRQEFVDTLHSEGLAIEVLSGEAEAALGVLAVANGSHLADAWVVDLGGGSMQVSRMAARQSQGGQAYALGAIHATQEFLTSDVANAKQVRALEAAVDRRLGPVPEQIAATGLEVVAIGGTVRNLARAVQRRAGYRWRMLHAYGMRRQDLEELTQHLLVTPASQRAEVAGINAYRGDIILAGALVFRRLMQRADLRELHISSYGMREGAAFEAFLAPPHLLDDVRRFSIDNLLWQHPQPQAHNKRVRQLSRQLFDGLQPLHGYGSQEAELLDRAASLHDIGKSVAYRNHDKHGAYLLWGSPLPGFDQREHALLSLLVRYHRRGRPSRGRFGRVLDKRDRGLLRTLTICLRLAEYLDRSRTGRVRGVEVDLDSKAVRLRLLADGEAWVEFWETQKQAPLFEAAFERSLEVVSPA